MSLDALSARPVTVLAEDIRSGRISSADCTRACLDAVAERDGALQAFVRMAPDAMGAARAADAALAAGEEIGPLHGVPIAVKDNYTTRDMATEAGTLLPVDFPRQDAFAVSKLRAAGAVIVGKTRMHEFAWGMESPPARNPVDPERVPGGSSGGSGAAVAAGMVPAALGSDTGGSIRIPASLCGTVGFKPSFGRIGRSGIVPHSWSLDHAGPLTRTVADAALLVEVMSGRDPADPGSSSEPPPVLGPALSAGAGGLRVGVCRNHFFDTITEDVGASVEQSIEALSQAGAAVVDFEVPDLAYGLGAIFAIELASSTAYHARRLAAGEVSRFQPDVRLLVEMGRLVSAPDYVQAERYRRRLGEAFLAVFDNVDVVVGPTMPLTAWRVGDTHVEIDGVAESILAVSWRLTYPWNLLGLPAITLPCGRDRHGLPIGFQIAGAAFDEASVVRTAAALEGIVEHKGWMAR